MFRQESIRWLRINRPGCRHDLQIAWKEKSGEAMDSMASDMPEFPLSMSCFAPAKGPLHGAWQVLGMNFITGLCQAVRCGNMVALALMGLLSMSTNRLLVQGILHIYHLGAFGMDKA